MNPTMNPNHIMGVFHHRPLQILVYKYLALSFVVKLEHHSLFVFSMHYYKLGAWISDDFFSSLKLLMTRDHVHFGVFRNGGCPSEPPHCYVYWIVSSPRYGLHVKLSKPHPSLDGMWSFLSLTPSLDRMWSCLSLTPFFLGQQAHIPTFDKTEVDTRQYSPPFAPTSSSSSHQLSWVAKWVFISSLVYRLKIVCRWYRVWVFPCPSVTLHRVIEEYNHWIGELWLSPTQTDRQGRAKQGWCVPYLDKLLNATWKDSETSGTPGTSHWCEVSKAHCHKYPPSNMRTSSFAI